MSVGQLKLPVSDEELVLPMSVEKLELSVFVYLKINGQQAVVKQGTKGFTMIWMPRMGKRACKISYKRHAYTTER